MCLSLLESIPICKTPGVCPGGCGLQLAISAVVSRVLSLDDHLSSPAVTGGFQRSLRRHGGPPYRPHSDLASGGVYIAPPSPGRG